MRRTNILLEFSDEVYDTLVEPLKKSKGFTKLVTTLIDGYLQDNYIRAYADDTLDDIRHKAASSFNESIASMNETLSEMGLVTDELEANATGGRDLFKKKAEEQAEELSNSGVSVSGQELSAVNERIDKIQDSIQGMVAMLTEWVKAGQTPFNPDMLKSAMQEEVKPTSVANMAEEKAMPVNQIVQAEEKTPEVTDVKPNSEKDYFVAGPLSEDSGDSDMNDFSSGAKDVADEVSDEASPDEGEEPSEDVALASDFMASMLAGNAFEY